MKARQVELALVGEPHRLWCGLFLSDVPRCTCGQLTVEQLVSWWSGQARASLITASRPAASLPLAGAAR